MLMVLGCIAIQTPNMQGIFDYNINISIILDGSTENTVSMDLVYPIKGEK